MAQAGAHSLLTEVSIGLAGCGAGIAGFMNRSPLRCEGGAGGLLAPTVWRFPGTQTGGCN